MQDTEKKNALLAERKALSDAFTAVTLDWIKTEGKDQQLVNLRELIRMRLRAHYYELDPYIRGRNVYHRQGTIEGNGLVHFESVLVSCPR